jgi:hypothetical protein
MRQRDPDDRATALIFIEFAAQQWTLTSDVPNLSVYAVRHVVDEQSFSHGGIRASVWSWPK